MIRKLNSLSRKSLLLLLVLIIAVAGAVYYLNGRGSSPSATGQPEYINFSGNFVFTVPKSFNVDEQSIPGAELVYSAPLSVKTLDDIYNQNGIALQPTSGLTDHSSGAFKNYVNNTFVTDLKKNLPTSEVSVKFGKANGSDNAKVNVKKDGQQSRFIYLKGGQHPATVVAKDETDAFKTIEGTITDVEQSDLKSEIDAIKKSIQSNLELAKAQKANQMYDGASADLRSSNTQAQLTAALSSATSYLNQNIVVGGGSYSPNEFTASLRFTPLNKDSSPSSAGSLTLKKIDGQWKLKAITLPAKQ